MDGGWNDLVHDLTLDLRAIGHGQFVNVEHCTGLDPNPYVQGAPDGAGGWYCELVSQRYLPATVWPIDQWYLMAAGWTPPTNPDDNWSHTAADPTTAARMLVDGLRHGRMCLDWQQAIWRTARFPAPPGRQGPEDEPMVPVPAAPVPVAA